MGSTVPRLLCLRYIRKLAEQEAGSDRERKPGGSTPPWFVLLFLLESLIRLPSVMNRDLEVLR